MLLLNEYMLCERMPGVQVIGISGAQGYLHDQRGLPIEQLFIAGWRTERLKRNFPNEVMISDHVYRMPSSALPPTICCENQLFA